MMKTSFEIIQNLLEYSVHFLLALVWIFHMVSYNDIIWNEVVLCVLCFFSLFPSFFWVTNE